MLKVFLSDNLSVELRIPACQAKPTGKENHSRWSQVLGGGRRSIIVNFELVFDRAIAACLPKAGQER